MKKKNRYLFDLFLSQFINKTSLIFLALSVLISGVILVFLNDLGLNNDTYSLEYENIITSYVNESSLIMRILNLVFAAFLPFMELLKGMKGYEVSFVCNVGRRKVFFTKFLAYEFLILFFLFYEYIFFILIGYLLYPDFFLFNGLIDIFINNFLDTNIILLFSLLIVNLIPNFFTLVGNFFLFFLFNLFLDSTILMDNSNLALIFTFIYPVSRIVVENYSISYVLPIINLYSLLYVFMLLFLTYSIYDNKDLI